MDTGRAWNSGRPIYSRLPGANEGYNGNIVADWLTINWDADLLALKAAIDEIPARQLDPMTCDLDWLSFLAALAGFTGEYWDEAWPESARRALVRDSFLLIWPNKGSRFVLEYLLSLFEIAANIWIGSALIADQSTLPATLGQPEWRYVIQLPLDYLRNSFQFRLAEKLDRLYSPLFADGRVAYEQFYADFSITGDPVF